MWEFSWLVRRIAPEAEYADWDTVLDELTDRGYDCIRIDAFPHLIAAGPDGAHVERFTIAPRAPLSKSSALSSSPDELAAFTPAPRVDEKPGAEGGGRSGA